MSPFNALTKGTQLNSRYTIYRIIGKGRSSAVYESLDEKTQSSVAIKIMDPFVAQDPINVERFNQEVRILRQLDHPGVIKVFDVFTEGELKAIVMEYFPSLDCAQFLAKNGRPTIPMFLEIAKSIIETVKACHRLNVVHRDLKPQNILIGESHQIKLVDFGISRMSATSDLTKTGTIIGTPEYMPPEAFYGSHYDPRSDIYSLGSLFYEMLSGFPPYSGQSLQQIMVAQSKGNLKSISELQSDVPIWLNDIVLKCLKFDPIQRYQNCGELLKDLSAGEKALAKLEKEIVANKCLSCDERMLPGLSFCHLCGKFQSEVYQSGPYSILLLNAENSTELEKYLLRSFPQISTSRLKSKLKQLPILLFKGVDKKTTEILTNELYNHPVQLQVVKSLPREFGLTGSYFAIAGLGLVSIIMFPSVSVPIKAAFISVTELCIFLWFARKTVATINLKSLKFRARKGLPAVVNLAARISQIGDARLQAIFGSIILTFQKMKAQGLKESDDIQNSLKIALEFSIRLGLIAKYLAETNPVQIRKNLEVADLKIKKGENIAELENLIQMKSVLLQSYKDYRAAQEQYADGICTLLSFHEHIKFHTNAEFEWKADTSELVTA